MKEQLRYTIASCNSVYGLFLKNFEFNKVLSIGN